ncbi:unnamed protein product [Oikopleura dioica]|uniref:Uncharacterized protein n=1 Tax=Oikopleura dioica TaxID=34765 RepID=E4Z5B5_OIKDI|nr:unnamed protein product [Oikopleura dioica]
MLVMENINPCEATSRLSHTFLLHKPRKLSKFSNTSQTTILTTSASLQSKLLSSLRSATSSLICLSMTSGSSRLSRKKVQYSMLL